MKIKIFTYIILLCSLFSSFPIAFADDLSTSWSENPSYLELEKARFPKKNFDSTLSDIDKYNHIESRIDDIVVTDKLKEYNDLYSENKNKEDAQKPSSTALKKKEEDYSGFFNKNRIPILKYFFTTPEEEEEDKKLPLPGKLVGTYSSVKLFYDIPMMTSIKATENRLENSTSNKKNLFSGDLSYQGLPSLAIAVGSDMKGWYRGEIEASFIPTLIDKIDITTDKADNPKANFHTDSSQLSSFIVNISTNHFIEKDIMEGKYMLFAGGGIGLAFVVPFNNTYVDSAFALPTLQVIAGVNFTLTQKSKLSVIWRMFYANFTLDNKQPFQDTTSVANGGLIDTRPIDNGSGISFMNFLTNGVGIEYMFYP